MNPCWILVVDHEDDYGPPDLHGPFIHVSKAQHYAENLRETLDLPREATPENNDEWTDAGWYFGIFSPKIDARIMGL